MSSTPGPQPAEGEPPTSPQPDASEDAGFGGISWAEEGDGQPEAGDGPWPPGPPGFPDGLAPPDPPAPGAPFTPGEPGAPPPVISFEDLVVDLERVSAERNQYLEASRRIQAEFENYKKAVAKREVEARERANETLVTEILPVLDACDGALANGATDVEPVRTALVEALAKQGLDRIDGQDEAFDPVLHDAVMHEPSEDDFGPVVAEVMRAGYRWKGRVLRPAMVRVRG